MARAADAVSATRSARKKRRQSKRGTRRSIEQRLPQEVMLVVNDDSNEPDIYQGERIVVRLGETPNENEYVIARLPNGEHELRKYRPLRDGAFDLVPGNPKYESIPSRAGNAPKSLLCS